MPVDPATVALAIRGLDTLTTVVANAMRARAEMRALAEKAGASKEDLDASDERFQRHYADPLAGEP